VAEDGMKLHTNRTKWKKKAKQLMGRQKKMKVKCDRRFKDVESAE
jgi:hypothetical protein